MIRNSISLTKMEIESLHKLNNSSFILYATSKLYSNSNGEFTLPHSIFSKFMSNQTFINARNELIKNGFWEEFKSNKDIKKENVYRLSTKWEVNCCLNRKSTNVGYLYVVKMGEHYKIGISKNPKTRLQEFTKLPYCLETIVCKKIVGYDDIEKELHLFFKDKCIRGEWHSLNSEDIDYIKNYLKQNE